MKTKNPPKHAMKNERFRTNITSLETAAFCILAYPRSCGLSYSLYYTLSVYLVITSGGRNASFAARHFIWHLFLSCRAQGMKRRNSFILAMLCAVISGDIP